MSAADLKPYELMQQAADFFERSGRRGHVRNPPTETGRLENLPHGQFTKLAAA